MTKPFPPKAADVLGITPEIAEEIDRVMGASDTHKPPLGDDMVVLPKHYARFEIEPVHFLAANKVNIFQFNIVKYIMRCEHKHQDTGKQDILKVIRYAIMYAKYLQGQPDWWKAYHNEGLAQALSEEIGNGLIYKRA